MGGDYFALVSGVGGIGQGRPERGDHPRGRSLRWAPCPIYRFGSEAQKQEWLAAVGQWHARWAAFGLTEPGGGHRCRRERRPPRQLDERPLDDQRLQAVHHQLRHRYHQAGHRHRSDRCQATDGKKEISSILDSGAPPPGFTVEPAYDKVGWNASDTHPLSVRRRAGARSESARGARPRLRQLPAHPRRGPHRDRRAVHRRVAAQGCVDESDQVRARSAKLSDKPDRTRYQSIAFTIARMEARAHTSPAPLITTRRR